MPKFKNLANFSDFKRLKGDQNHFSHKVYVLKKKKNQNNWYLKHLGENLTEAFIETIAQEFFRLILPYHPKTRIAIKEGTKNYYVLSKEILNFDANFFLAPENNKRIIDKDVTGLAAAQVLALLLNEIDFKPCNVGVADKKVIKIDGGLCFARLNSNLNALFKGKNMDITQTDIEALPALIHYEPSNWLNLIKWNPKEKQAQKNLPTAEDRTINKMPNFKHELYKTILRVILLSDNLIRFFTQSYTPDGISHDYTNRISNTLIARKHQLAQAAYQIPAFNDYRLSHSADEETLAYLEQLKKFKPIGSSFLVADFNKKFNSNSNSNSNLEETIIEKHRYSTIKEISKEFVLYETRLNDPLSIESLLLLCAEDRQCIIKYLEEKKPIFTQYLNSPKINYFNELNSALLKIKEELDFLSKNCLFIPRINALLEKLKPIETTSNQNKRLNSSSFFAKIKLPTSETYSRNMKTISHFYAG